MFYICKKSEILEMYLNTVPYGARINGVKVASKYYFKKLPKDLTEAEALIDVFIQIRSSFHKALELRSDVKIEMSCI